MSDKIKKDLAEAISFRPNNRDLWLSFQCKYFSFLPQYLLICQEKILPILLHLQVKGGNDNRNEEVDHKKGAKHEEN